MNATAINSLTSLVVAVLLAGAAAVLAEDEITAGPAAELSAAIDPL